MIVAGVVLLVWAVRNARATRWREQTPLTSRR